METESQYKELLSELENIRSSDGAKTLLDHLSNMFKVKLEMGDDIKYNDLFEDISIRLKHQGYYINETLSKEHLHKFLSDFSQNIPKQKSLLKPLTKKDEDVGEDEVEKEIPVESVNYVPDYHEIFKQLSWCGVSLSERESLLLRNSLRNLTSKLEGATVTFFGKIRGTIKDYYICEVSGLSSEGEANEDSDIEPRGTDGVNMLVYYVTNDLTDNWVELPDVLPSQVRASRVIRYAFTGDLHRTLYTNPHFDGQEQHYLRCQIARIYHGTKLVPHVNHYKVDESEAFKPLVPPEKAMPIKHEDLIKLNTWIHYPPGILKEGRVNHLIRTPEEVDPDEYRKKIIEKDPFDKRIKPVSEDEKITTSSLAKIKVTPWKVIQGYEDNVYVNPYIKLLDETAPDFDPNEQKDNKADYSVVCVKSLRWPGAYNFYVGKETYFFYFGDGLKFVNTESDGAFVYKAFPRIPDDLEDLEDEPEPVDPPKEENPEEEGEEGGEEGNEQEGEEN